MYIIQIINEGYLADLSPACEFQLTGNFLVATAVWQFMIDNLRSGWRVTLVDEAGDALKSALSGETTLPPPPETGLRGEDKGVG